MIEIIVHGLFFLLWFVLGLSLAFRIFNPRPYHEIEFETEKDANNFTIKCILFSLAFSSFFDFILYAIDC